jgi:hypothetical protein
MRWKVDINRYIELEVEKKMKVWGSVLANGKRPSDSRKRDATRIYSLYVRLDGKIIYLYR